MKRDHLAGVLLVVLGLGAAVEGYSHTLGTFGRMGSGMVPFALGLLLAGLGVAVAGTAGQAAAGPALPQVVGEHAEFAGAEWRGWGCIVAGVLAFLLLGTYGGLVPATFACVFVAARGDRSGSLRESAGLAAAVTVLGVLLFHYALRVQLPLFQWPA